LPFADAGKSPQFTQYVKGVTGETAFTIDGGRECGVDCTRATQIT